MKENLVRVIDWDAYKKNLEGSIENEKIWSMGDLDGINCHEENIAILKEELDMVNDGQFQSVVDEKFKDMGNDAVEYFSDFLRITDINISSRKNGGMYITCKVDGVKQMGERLKPEDMRTLADDTDRIELAARYFKNALVAGQEQSRSMKR